MQTCILLAGLALTTGLTAQPFYSVVGNGTTSNLNTGYPAPYGNWYYGAKHQFYVTPAELTAAGMSGGIAVKSLGFNVTNKNTAASPQTNWSVVVYTTSSSNPLTGGFLTSGAVATSTLSSPVPTIGWNMTPVSQFIWDGVSGLVIETCFNNTFFEYNHSHEWTTNLSGATFSIWRNADAAGQCTMNSVSASTNTRPNIRFEWEFLTPCTGNPGPNSVLAPTFAICPNSTVGLALSSSYTVGNLTYQWQSSTLSAVGPFTPVTVNGGTNVAYNTPSLNVNTWYNVVITCPNQGTTTSAIAGITIAPVTTDSVPYYENFDLIGKEDRLPNCSWAASGMFTSTRTYTGALSGNRLPRSGTSYATFTNTPGTHYFYTNGIYMQPGITYSTSLWYTTDLTGATNWSNLGIYLGTTQTPTGLVPLATINGAVVSPAYKSLSNTFTVSSAGFYYVAVRATGAAGNAQFLSWDDLRIEIPCQSAPNTPTITLTANQNTVCQGTPVTLTGVGSGILNWNDGSTGNSTVLTDMPYVSTLYMVTATNPLTKCTSTASSYVKVEQAPVLSAIAVPAAACPGKPVSLQASGASSYVWSSGGVGAAITVTPNGNMSYNVIGTGTNNCTGMASISVSVYPSTQVTSSASKNEICRNEGVTLSAQGVQSYVWINSLTSNLLQGPQVVVFPSSIAMYTVTGTDVNGCESTSFLTVNVLECVGIAENPSMDRSVRIYPNPSTGIFNIETSGEKIGSIVVTDVTGRVVLQKEESSSRTVISLESSAAGVYYVKINGTYTAEVVRVIKD